VFVQRLNAVQIALAITSLFAATSTAFAQEPTQSALQQCIANEAKNSSFSGVVSIARPSGSVTFEQGLMAGKGSAAITPDAQFNIGSAGKMWTAVAVAQLVDAGKFGLDDNVGRYLAGLTPEASAVTVRQLLTHSSGLGNFFTPDNMGLFKRARSLSELKPLIIDEKPSFAPGSKSQYSNSGFLLLGLLIEQVSGQQYGDYLQERIFKPAGMTGSSVMPADPNIRAIGMTNFPELDDKPDGPRRGPPPGARAAPSLGGPMPPQASGPLPPPPGPLRPSMEAAIMGTSAGGSFSTAADMQRFFAALQAGKLTSAAMQKALTSPQFEILPAKGNLPAVHSGLGFVLGDRKGRGWFGHNGGAPGLNIATSAFPADQTTTVVMSNRDPPVADQMLRKVNAMLFDAESCNQR
jgi:D-alanyl-D-alanine carboxypeptidase